MCVCVFANATNCRGALIRSFIHSFSHSFRSRSLVSQSVRQARQSFSRCQNCHAPRPRSTFHVCSSSRSIFSQPGAGQSASQLLGSQSGQSTFSIDVARLRTHIASRTKQSPVSNSVRHSLTESCLPFISICQSGQQPRQRAPAPKIPQQHQLRLLLNSLCFLLYIVSYALFYLQHCVLPERSGKRGRGKFGSGIGIFSMLARAKTRWGHSNRYGFNSFLAYFHFKFIFS